MAPQYSTPANRTAYFEKVWELVRQIPEGKVSTYGRLAAYLPPPAGMSERAYQVRGARMVGGAMAACPEDVPWQRVINSQGKVSQRKGVAANSSAFYWKLKGFVLMNENGLTYRILAGRVHPRIGSRSKINNLVGKEGSHARDFPKNRNNFPN